MAELSLYSNTSQTKPQKKHQARGHTVSKKDLLAVTEHAPDVICRFDKALRMLYVNPAIELATGVPTHVFINKTTRELGMPVEHADRWEHNLGLVYSTSQPATFEFPFLTPTGIRFFHALLVPEFTDDGRVDTVLTISRDITDKKEQDRKKEETVSLVSHELKTPVTSLKLSTQMLKQKFAKGGDEHTAQHLERMDQQIDKLNNIISDLMDTTRIEHGSMRLKMEEFDINVLIKETAKEVQKISSLHTIAIQGKSELLAFGDRSRIEQVVTNLLTNAIRYSPSNSVIIVSLSSDPKWITCRVQDFGRGIPHDQQEKIFERFYRVKEVEQEFYMGMGLGLYISSEIIKRHKGNIWVKSEPGLGSTFYFSLPLRKN